MKQKHHDSNAPSPPAPGIRYSLWETFWASMFVLGWLVPISYVGLFNKPLPIASMARIGVPSKISDQVANYCNNQYRISCLFPDRVPSWGQYYYQLRTEGPNQWFTVPESDYARLKPFGYRSRLKRMLGRNQGSSAKLRLAEMAEFFKKRFEELYPDKGNVTGMRIIRARYLAGEEIIAKPTKHWSRPPLEEVDRERIYLHYSHTFKSDG